MADLFALRYPVGGADGVGGQKDETLAPTRTLNVYGRTAQFRRQ